MAAPAVLQQLRQRLTSLAKISTGSSNLIRRAIPVLEPLSMDAGEMTDKGSINQRLVLRNRTALVEQLYAEAPTDHVISIDKAI